MHRRRPINFPIPSMTHGLSFSPDFFSGSEIQGHESPREVQRPRNVSEAIMSLSQETWNELAEQVFGVDPSQLDLSMVLSRIEETNTCRNLNSPVEVFIDPEGDFTVSVYDPDDSSRDRPELSL